MKRRIRKSLLGVGIFVAVATTALGVAAYRELLLELRPSPGFLLNGSFQGHWTREVDDQGIPSGVERIPSSLEIRITENVRLAKWTAHPEMFSLEEGVLARGELRIDETTRPCEFIVEGGEFRIRFLPPGERADIGMWMWAVQYRFTPTPWHDQSSDELDLTFLPNQVPIRFERADRDR